MKIAPGAKLSSLLFSPSSGLSTATTDRGEGGKLCFFLLLPSLSHAREMETARLMPELLLLLHARERWLSREEGCQMNIRTYQEFCLAGLDIGYSYSISKL